MFGTRPAHFRTEKKKRKREQHEKRVANWQTLSPEEQLAALDVTFGDGNGATRQRSRIAKAIEETDKQKEN